MLIVSRKKNESIVISDDITVVVVEIRGDKVRLGIEHPRDCSVHRREVYEAIHRTEPAPPRKTAMIIPETGLKALATIRRQITSQQDDATLVTAILEAVAAKGITAADLDSFKEKI